MGNCSYLVYASEYEGHMTKEEKSKDSDTLQKLENLLEKDIRNNDSRYTFSRLFLFRLAVRFAIYFILILVLYLFHVIDSFRIVLAAVTFFVLLELLRYAWKRKNETP